MILDFLFPFGSSPQSQIAGCQSDGMMGTLVDEEEKWVETVF